MSPANCGFAARLCAAASICRHISPDLPTTACPGERYIAYHRQRARAGLGMQITGATPVIWSDVWADGLTLVNIDDRIVPGYRRLAAAVHEEGGLMLAQLAHVGAMETAGDAIVSASGVRSEITQRTARQASTDELAEILEAYRAAARRCREGELDGVEVTMAHGMLLASFLSPLMNRRDDRYGGDLEGRTLYPREVLAAVRDAMGPEAIIGVRLPGDELVEGGIDAQEAAAIAQTPRPRAARSTMSASPRATTRSSSRASITGRRRRRRSAPFAICRARSRSAVDVPVATVGRVTTLALAEEILASGDADLVGMVRAHIADPELLPKSRANGGSPAVRPCIGANVCINSLLAHKPLTCLANPDVGRPGQDVARDWGEGRRAIVVGGGPAGLEAARRLALGGWATSLIERERTFGGQMARWCADAVALRVPAPDRLVGRAKLERLGVDDAARRRRHARQPCVRSARSRGDRDRLGLLSCGRRRASARQSRRSAPTTPPPPRRPRRRARRNGGIGGAVSPRNGCR